MAEPALSTREFLDSRERELAITVAKLTDQLAPLERELAEVRSIRAKFGARREFDPSPSVARMTMKQLAVKALTERFRAGATTRQLIDFFDHGFGRNIARQSLSPQLTRLIRDGIIERRGALFMLRQP